MATMLDCSGPNCIETFIETGISTVFAILAINGLRIIFRDRNKLLSRLNKIIFGIATVQLCLLVMYFTIWGSDFIISTIRCLRILNELILCAVLSEMVVDETTYNRLISAFKIVGLFIFVEWFWTAVVNQSTYDYYCLEMDYIYLSGTTLILTLLAGYFGLIAVEQLQTIKEESKQGDRDDMDNKGSEIKVFLACDSIAAIIQFAWDYIANMNSVTVEDCKSYYEASDIGTIFIISLMKMITLMISPMAIYNVLYYKYRNQFNNRAANVLDIGVLDDRRSELAQELTDV